MTANYTHFGYLYSPNTNKITIVVNKKNYSAFYLFGSPFLQALGFRNLFDVPEVLNREYKYSGSISRRPGDETPKQRTDLQYYVGDSMVDVSGTRTILIKPSFGLLGNAVSMVLAKVPVDVSFGGVVQYQNPNAFRAKMFSGEQVSSIFLTFVDEITGKNINFNGMSWSVTLQFDFLKPDQDFDLPKPDSELQPDYAVMQYKEPDDGTPPERNLMDFADENPQDISA
jgi:hypothetical protein